MSDVNDIMKMVRKTIKTPEILEDMSKTLELTNMVCDEEIRGLIRANLRPLLEQYLDKNIEDIARQEIRRILQEREEATR